MSNGSVEQRLTAVEAQMQELRDIVLQMAQAQVRTQAQLDEASAIARSNARSISAWEALIQQNKDEAEEELSRQAVWIRDLQEANRENVLQHMEFRQNHTDALRRFDETQATINRILDRLGGSL